MALKKTKVELNNAIFSLPDYVARDDGYFEEERLYVELVDPGRLREAMAESAGPVSNPKETCRL